MIIYFSQVSSRDLLRLSILLESLYQILTPLILLFWAVLRDPIACSLLVGGIPSQNSGYKVTILCPSFMISFYFLPPPSFPSRRRFWGHSLLLAYRLLCFQFLRSLSPPNIDRPVPTTSGTPSPLASERTNHRGPESVALQYTTRPCSASS